MKNATFAPLVPGSETSISKSCIVVLRVETIEIFAVLFDELRFRKVPCDP